MSGQSVKFFANGKLLLTAEYFVLQGAKALALPVKFGQSLSVIPPSSYHSKDSGKKTKQIAHSSFFWQSFYLDRPWFSAEINSANFSIEKASDRFKAETLVQLLKIAHEQNPKFAIESGTTVKTVLDFDPEWGLGSSSTLVSCLAYWADIDPFLLNEKVFHGSGFDIACARSEEPLFYTKGRSPEIVGLEYPFEENLFFVYSGRKQNTRVSIASNNIRVSALKRKEISDLTEQIAFSDNLEEFKELIKIHEKEVAALIGHEPVQQKFFTDFNGVIKSLGAWGGDFLLLATDWDFPEVKKYFSKKGMKEIFRWNEMVK